MVRLGSNLQLFQLLTNEYLENVGPYDNWTYTQHLQQGFTASVEDGNGEWVDSPVLITPGSPTERSCAFCGETILLEGDDPWMHEGTGEEHCEGSEEFATPQEDYARETWYPLDTRETEYVSEDFLIGPFIMTYSAAVCTENGKAVKCLMPSAEMGYGVDGTTESWCGTRWEVLADAKTYRARLRPFVEQLGGTIALVEDGAPYFGHLLEVLVPIDNVLAAYPTASAWFDAFGTALDTPLPEEN